MACFWRIICLLLSFLLVLSGCASGKAPAGDAARAEALGNAFINDLPQYVWLREDIDALRLLDAVVTTDRATYRANLAEDFFARYERGEDASLTVISAKSAFVVIRVVFEDSAGYYLRYQHDPKAADNSYAITSSFLEEARLNRREETGSLELELSGGGAQVAVIPMKNIVESEVPPISSSAEPDSSQ